MGNLILVVAIFGGFFLALRKIYKNKGGCGCSSGCSGCQSAGNCAQNREQE